MLEQGPHLHLHGKTSARRSIQLHVRPCRRPRGGSPVYVVEGDCGVHIHVGLHTGEIFIFINYRSLPGQGPLGAELLLGLPGVLAVEPPQADQDQADHGKESSAPSDGGHVDLIE